MTDIKQTLADNERLRAIVRAEVALTVAAYGLEVAAVEHAWDEARQQTEARRGVGLWMFFHAPIIFGRV